MIQKNKFIAFLVIFVFYVACGTAVEAREFFEPITNEVGFGNPLRQIVESFFLDLYQWKEIMKSKFKRVANLPSDLLALIRFGRKLPPSGKAALYSEGLENVALGKPIIEERGQVDYKDYAQRLTSENITDGDFKSGWRTVTDRKYNNAMAVIDLLGEKLISKVVFKAGWDRKPQFDREIAFQVDYSNLDKVEMTSETDWIKLGTRYVSIDKKGYLHEIRFLPVTAKYIRVQYLVEDYQWGGWGNLSEVMVFGE